MIRLVSYFIAVALLALGLSWLADRPGNLLINWQGYEIETSVFRAVVLLALAIAVGVVLWSLLRQAWMSPALIGGYFHRRRQERGLDALSSGMIAIGAGDRTLASRYALQARKALPNEPLTHLLRAQAAQLSGDRSTSRRIFEAMLSQPDTEQLGLRGLFLEAEREGEKVAARQFAERALQLNPKLGWPVDALLAMQCRDGDYEAALETLSVGRRIGHFDKTMADRHRAVLLTGIAQDLEEANGAKALDMALEAHGLAPSLIPAAVIAGRQLASRGATPRAAKIIERTWKAAPHPDLALVYAFARPGDSPRDRLDRIRRLSKLAPGSVEGPIALAKTAVEAREWETARSALEPLADARQSQRVCTLIARLEGEQHQDAGRVREWLARAVNAPRDPAWTADGVVSDRWAPVSPVTGAIDAFEWRVPAETAADSNSERALKTIEELVLLGTAPDVSSNAHRDEPGPQTARAEDASPRVASPVTGTASTAIDAVRAPVAARPKLPEGATGARLAPAAAAGLRMRDPAVERPITIEVEPVETGMPSARSAMASSANGHDKDDTGHTDAVARVGTEKIGKS